MTEERAIEILKEWLCNVHSKFCSVGAVGIPNKEWYATEIVLNLIQKQDKKIIDLKETIKKQEKSREHLKKQLKGEIAVKDTEINKLNNVIDRIKNYTYQEVAHITEDIKDYIDDDKEGNKHIIGELKEEREQWKDIMRIIEGKEDTDLYINWKEWGEYE